MKKRIVLPMAVLMMVSLAGLSVAQPMTVEQPAHSKMAEMAKTEMPKVARLHRLAGDVVAVDRMAKTVTIKHMVRGRPKEATFNVGEKAAPSLVDLKPNDQVRLSYYKEHGQLIAQSIVATSHQASK
jgi:Cu/Ag efflux protein CusF